MKCRKCGKTVHEIGNRYLKSANETGKGAPFECHPPCDLPFAEYKNNDEAVLAAVTGEEP